MTPLRLEEDEMYTAFSGEIAAQRIADLHRQAAKDRLVHQLRAGRKRTARDRRVWERLTFRHPRSAVA